MRKTKKGCVQIHWGYGSGRSNTWYQPSMEIMLVKTDWWGSLNTGLALSLSKKSSVGGRNICKVKAVRLPTIKNNPTDGPLDTAEVARLFDEAPSQGNLTEKRCSYIEGLVESIQLQPRKNKAIYADRGRYHLEIKRAETEICLDWSDRVEVWPGVIDLVNALEEIYSQLVEKDATITNEDLNQKPGATLQSVVL